MIQSWYATALDALSKLIRARFESSSPGSANELDQLFGVPDEDIVELFRQVMVLAELQGRLEVMGDQAQRSKGTKVQSDTPDLSGSVPSASLMIANAAGIAAENLFNRLPFIQAIERLLGRNPTLKPVFLELNQAARSRAFTMARTLDEHVLADVKSQLTESLNSGETFRTFWERMQQVAKSNDWIGTTERHARQVYEENLGQVYSQGRTDQGRDLGMKAWRFLPSLSDNPRASHEPFYNQVFKDVPGSPRPPLDYGCNCGWEWVDYVELEQLGIDPETLPEFVPPPTDTDYLAAVAKEKVDMSKSQNIKTEDGAEAIACDLVAIPPTAGGEPMQVVLCPAGEVKSKSGTFIVDAEAADQVIARFKGHNVDLVVDYEHASLGGEHASPDGTAPAAGWVSGLSFDPQRGIIGSVRWTERAQKMIAAKEYRYLSPVVLARKSDRRAIAFGPVGLTNTPAIPGMPAIVNRAWTTGKDTNPVARLCAQTFIRSVTMAHGKDGARQIVNSSNLSAEEKKTLTALVDALPDETQIVVNKETADAAVALATELKDGTVLQAAQKGDLVVVINAATKRIAGMVPATELSALQAEVNTLKAEALDRDCETLLSVNSTKVPPAKREWFKNFFSKDRAAAEAWIKDAPEVVVNKPVASDGSAPGLGDPEAEWQANSQVRKEFGDNKDAYLAFCKASSEGRVRIYGAKKS